MAQWLEKVSRFILKIVLVNLLKLKDRLYVALKSNLDVVTEKIRLYAIHTLLDF